MSILRTQLVAALNHSVIALHWLARTTPQSMAAQIRRIADSLSERARRIHEADEHDEPTDDPLDPGPSPTSLPPRRSAQTRGQTRIYGVDDSEAPTEKVKKPDEP